MEKFIILKSLKSKKMRRDVLAVLGIIIVYRFLAHVPIPLAEPSQLKQLVDGILKNQQTLGFFDILSGGALASFSIMLLGLGPYINSSIIIQILSKAIPKLEERQKEGEHARKRINQYTRMITLPLAVLQSVGILVLLRQQTIASSLGIDISQNAGFSQWAVMVMSLTAGSMLLMWLGEIITEKGLANGISLVIFAGVASRLPRTAITLWSTIRGEAADHLKVFGTTLPVSGKGAAIAGAIIAFTIFLTYWVVKINEAQRIITVHYAKRVRGSREYGGITTIIPLKLISAGVIPIIFAYSILSGLQFIGNLLKGVSSELFSKLGQNLVTWFQTPSSSSSVLYSGNIYIAVYAALILFFTYFYTKMIFNPKEMSEQLQQSGGFIEGVKPGSNTEKYFNQVMNRLTLTGSVSIAVLAVIPLIAERFIQSSVLTLGGTSLLITVSVALETLRQMRSKALMYSYDLDYADLSSSIHGLEDGNDSTQNSKRTKLKSAKPKISKLSKLNLRTNKSKNNSKVNNKSSKKNSKPQKGLQKRAK